jgi:hypothetical protein
MKTFGKLMILSILILSCEQTLTAQNTRKEKQAAKAAAVKKMVDDVNYIFEANLAYPMRGGSRQLTGEYDLRVLKDTVTAYLPYFGRAFVAPIDPTEGGIKFTWTKFEYSTKQLKNGNWEITIKPKEKNIGRMTDVQQLRLSISSAGYASLQVTSSNRDPISFQGEIVQKTK